jgi:hypothetical protein
MSAMRNATALLLPLIPIAVSAAEPGNFLSTPTANLTLTVANPQDLAKGLLFVSADHGASWLRAAEVVAEPGKPVVFTFNAPSDGTFLVKTCAVFLPGKGQPEPEPMAGTVPPNAMTLVVDTAPPAVRSLKADFLEKDRGAGPLSLRVAWEVSDPHIDSTRVDISSDEGKTWSELPGGGAGSGELTASLNPSAEIAAMLVRIFAKDKAGNQVTSGPTMVAVPKPRDPEADLRKAVVALPAVDDLIAQPAARPATASTAAASTTAAPATATVTAPATAATPVSATPVAAAPTTAAPAASVAAPAASSATSTAPAAPSSTDSGTIYGKAAVRNPVPASPPPPADLPTTAPLDAPFVFGEAARDLLEEARSLAAHGDPVQTLRRYLRLHRSDVAKRAVSEELAFARGLGAWATVIGIVENLPPELVTDAARVEHGRALIAIGRDQDAISVLSAVSTRSYDARPAMLHLARAMNNLGKTDQAKRIFEHLAKGEDEAAAAARGELGR